jgi:hypothetical protein
MAATTHHDSTDHPRDARDEASDSAAVGIAYAFGGIVAAVISIFVVLLIVGLSIALAQSIADVEACAEGFSRSATIALLAWGFAVSLFFGFALFRWRRFVGAHGHDEDASSSDADFAAMIRKRFTYGSMITYCALLPFCWVFTSASANCAGNLF